MPFSMAVSAKLLLHLMSLSVSLSLESTETAEVWKSGAVLVGKPSVDVRLETAERDLQSSRAHAAGLQTTANKEKERAADLEQEVNKANERLRALETYIQTRDKVSIDKVLDSKESKGLATRSIEEMEGDDPMNKPTVRLPLVLLQTFAAISLGYFCKEFRLLNPQNGDMKAVDFFVGKIAFPMLIFRTVATANIGAIDFRVVLACAMGKIVVMLATWFFTYFAYGRGSDKMTTTGERIITSTVFSFFTVASNDFGIGFPVILALYGAESSMPVYIAANALANAVFFQPLAMVLFEVGKSVKPQEDGSDDAQGPSNRSMVKRILLNPVMAWTILGIVYQSGAGIWYNMMHLSRDMGKYILPHPLSDVVDLFTAPFTMLALFQTGMSLETPRITFWPGFLVVMKVIICAYVSFLCSYYLMGPAVDSLQASLHNFTFFYGMIPSSTAPLVFASEFDPASEGIIATGILLGLAFAGPNIFVTALFLSDDAKDRTSTLVDVQTETAHMGVPCAVIFLCFVLATGQEWRTWRRFSIMIYGLASILYLASLLKGQRSPDLCKSWPQYPWMTSKLWFSWIQNCCVFLVFYLQWLLVSGHKKRPPSDFIWLGIMVSIVTITIEPFTMDEVCSLHLSQRSLTMMSAWRGACVVCTILLTMKGVQGGKSTNMEGDDEGECSPRAASSRPYCRNSLNGYGGCDQPDVLQTASPPPKAAQFEAYKGSDQGESTIRIVVLMQSLRMALQCINTSSLVYSEKVMGSFTQMVIIESILEHGQIGFLVLAILCDNSFKGMITRLLDNISKAMGHGQSNVTKFFSPTAVL